MDRLLGGLFVGDNVVWYDDAGSLSSLFIQNFVYASQEQGKPIFYVTFNRSPRNLVDKLGSLAKSPKLTIVDCFTNGKGAGSNVFSKFYDENLDALNCRVIQVETPQDIANFTKTFYGLFEEVKDDVRFVFETLTGMAELWGGEDHIVRFYSHSCPRLYELNTIAYWLMEKKAHSSRVRARINHVAQVAIELSVKRGMTSLTLLKAENRQTDEINKPYHYWSRDLDVTFEADRRTTGKLELGARLKTLRTKRGLSQTELAKLVGLTSGTISQVESSQIYPSLPALLKIAEVLSVEVSAFFQKSGEFPDPVVFKRDEAIEVRFPNLPVESIKARLLAPFDFETHAEPYLIEVAPQAHLPSHFFIHKGEEIGYVLKGTLQMNLAKGMHTVQEGDVVYLTRDIPVQWKNPGPKIAKIFWVKMK